MREISADAWEVDCDVLCITTNGTVNNSVNVMGAGIAAAAKKRHPYLPLYYGMMIEQYGHHVFLMPDNLLMFPTKNEVEKPSSLARIAL